MGRFKPYEDKFVVYLSNSGGFLCWYNTHRTRRQYMFSPLHSWNATVTSPVKRTMTTCKQESRTPDLYILGNGMIMRDGKTNRIVRERKTDMGYGDVVLVEARRVNSYYYPENCQRVGDYIRYTNSQKIYIPAILHMTQT